MYADIIVDISQGKLDKSFQYAIPEELMGKVHIGSQVIVTFGNGKGRKLAGYVINMTEEAEIDPARIKPITALAATGIAAEGQMIALAAWMKSYYGCTMNQALKTVIPVKEKEKPREKKLVSLILTEDRAKDELNSMMANSRHSVPRERLLSALIDENSIPWDIITSKLNIPSTIIRDIEKRGWVSIESIRDYRDPLKTTVVSSKYQKRVDLNDEQQAAADRFRDDYLRGDYGTYLLHGVTGSGKTEVYMEMLDTVIAQGRQAIVLIPEIALTYQTVMRFYQRFGGRISIINSRMTKAERFDQFERAKNGDISIMVGPRSALFTPFSDIGLIIIDEEHESSYKSENVPRYHARETAIYRAGMSGASVVLGSATPSMEASYRAATGEYRLLELKTRARGQALPECEIIDMREELMSGNRSIISRRLKELMEDRLEKQEQTMLFINRRGMSAFVSCRACGHVIKCPHCDVSLSLHGTGQRARMVCHYCGYSQPEAKTCPSCGSKFIGGFKAGTEKIQQVVEEMFPTARVLRMDMDTTRGKEGHKDILEAFANHQADILVGTQMIVKGHDFSNVTLVGALAADMSLNSGDYHGSERTFQLLTQAAGRAGRGELAGNMIIQTYQPDSYSIRAAAMQDYDSFYQAELNFRRLVGYPPISHMLGILITSANENEVLKYSEAIAREIVFADKDIFMQGPWDAAVARINDIYRKVIYVKDPDYMRLVAIKDAVSDYVVNQRQYHRSNVWFDFDPISSI